MEDNVSKIKERLNVVDIISGYIKVQKSGINFKARCPFHNEKSPSFYISPERQIWHCFGCQKGGDMFSFVKEIEGIEFPEALRILAQRAGIKLEEFKSAVQDKRGVLFEICETASRFFEKQLYQSPAGKKALTYLKDRGLKDETIKEFRLGFAPDDWHSLSNFLRDCDFRDEDIINSGVAIRREDGSDMYDRFRSRIIFPISSINDQVVGFTGRVFNINPQSGIRNSESEQAAKYINTPQTAIYDKSRVLYGLNKAKTETRHADRCLLVEGNIDVIMSYQAGVKNVAGTSGTALTPSHLQLLQRYTNNLDFCFDTDQAGLVATRRGIGLALSQNFNIKIVHLNEPGCKDPADYVKKLGIKWSELAGSAKPVIDFYFDKLSADLDLATVEGKKAMIASLAPLIKRLSSSVEKSHWVSRLSSAFKTKEEAIETDINNAKDDLVSYIENRVVLDRVNQDTQRIGTGKDDMLSEALLAVIIKEPALFTKNIGEVKIELLDPATAEIINRLKERSIKNFNFNDFISGFNDEKKMKLEFAHLRSQELFKEFDEKNLMDEFIYIKSKIEQKAVVAQLTVLEMDIKAAEAAKDKNKILELLNKFSELTKELIKPSQK